MSVIATTTDDAGRLGAWIRRFISDRWLWRIRIGFIVAVHLIALPVLLSEEYGPFSMTMAFLTWALLNCIGLIVFRRPGVSAVLSLALIVVLIKLSQFKFSIMQLTLTFLDFLIIDRDTVSFLHSVFPQLKLQLVVGTVIAVPVALAVWRLDPFRIRRAAAAIGALVCAAAITVISVLNPEQPWEPFQGVNHVSNLARSGVVAVSQLTESGWIEADPVPLVGPARAAPLMPPPSCAPRAKRPNIVMVLDESSFDMSAAPGIKVPSGYKDYFKSSDGIQRSFVAESTGGPTWFTEFNVLTGLSARSFGALKFYVTRIAAGKVSRGLPSALQNCGYRTFSLYPTYGNFLSARSFQTSTGIGRFMDMADMGVDEDMQPDRFYFDQASQLITREHKSGQPLFLFVYLTANHFPWTSEYRTDLTPKDWSAPGNTAEVDEYLRRQAMTAEDYGNFLAKLKRDFPDEPFLVVRFGDHQPAIAQKLLEPNLPHTVLADRIRMHEPRYYKTYYAIDALNFSPDLSSALDTLDAAYLPIAIQDAAGVPLDATFAEQKSIMTRCKGVFYSCRGGAEAKRFNRMLIDAGLIKTP